VSQGASSEARQWVQNLQATNPSAEDVVDAIVRELAPAGGSPDEESFRDAMALAMHELLRDDTSVDPLSMRVNDIWELMKGYSSTKHEIASRVGFRLSINSRLGSQVICNDACALPAFHRQLADRW
jgi:plasmid maintenance system killer protein